MGELIMGGKEDQLLHRFQEEARRHIYDKERHELVATIALTTQFKMAANLAEKFGWDAVNDQLKVFWEQRFWERVQPAIDKHTNNSEPMDCVTMCKEIVGARLGYSDDEIVECLPNRCHVIRKHCFEAVVLKETGLMGKLYWPCTTFWAPKVAELVNPKMKMTFLNAECEGDDVCEILVTLDS
jgi:hypothetical protein